MLEIEIKPNLLDRKRKLVISPEVIEYDDTNWVDVPAARFLKNEVAAFRFGIEPIKGYIFTIGWRYVFQIKGINNKILTVKFTSLYGIRRKQLGQKYNDILKYFLDLYQDDLVNRYIDLFNQNAEVTVLDTLFTYDYVVINGLKLPYEDLCTKEYGTYYALYSKNNPKIYKSYDYLTDWNAVVVYGLSKQLLIHKGIIK